MWGLALLTLFKISFFITSVEIGIGLFGIFDVDSRLASNSSTIVAVAMYIYDQGMMLLQNYYVNNIYLSISLTW